MESCARDRGGGGREHLLACPGRVGAVSGQGRAAAPPVRAGGGQAAVRHRPRAAPAVLRRRRLSLRLRLLLDLLSQRLRVLLLPRRQHGQPALPQGRRRGGQICRSLAESGVNLLDLTLGEDPVLFEGGDFSPLVELVAAVRRTTGLPIMVSPGVVPLPVLAKLRAAGADFYAVYQETHTPELFARLRLGQDFEERVQARLDAHAVGLLVEDGLLSGVGDGPADRVRSVLAMQAAGDEQVRVMTLVPQEQTPLADVPVPDTWQEILTIAVMRLLMPDRLIPASLDVEGIGACAAASMRAPTWSPRWCRRRAALRRRARRVRGR